MFLLIALLVVAPGCRKMCCGSSKKKQDVYTQVDIPLAGGSEFEIADESVRSFFEADVDDLADDFVALAPQDVGMAMDAEHDKHDFAWAQDAQNEALPVYFDFDRFAVRQDQEPSVNKDIAFAQKVLAAESQNKASSVVVVEGHSCHSAGSDVYNLALSEKRAKTVADRLVSAGVSRENLKIVGRGNHIPAVINGREVTGDREQQAPNRRVEVHAIYS